ncbi:MAG: hypothetical protein MRY72_07140, partial [Aquisalinus sp.]|nr:hypothetical protein [Aquisalinus sp.]
FFMSSSLFCFHPNMVQMNPSAGQQYDNWKMIQFPLCAGMTDVRALIPQPRLYVSKNTSLKLPTKFWR